MLRETSRSIIDGCCFYFYQMHDAKLIYLLIQHAQWSRNMKAFLLCDCNKRDGVINDEYTCVIVLDKEQLLLYKKSENRWMKK